MRRVEKLCLQHAQHCCFLWPPRTLGQLFCFKVSSMWSCTGNPCSALSCALFFKRPKTFKMEGPFYCPCPLQLDMREETSLGLQVYAWGIPEIIHPSCLCRWLKDHALGLHWGLTASFSVWFLSPVAGKCGAEPESRPPWIIETWWFFYRMLTITAWVHQHDKISACWLIGKAVICHPIKPCGFVRFPQCFSQTSPCCLWVSWPWNAPQDTQAQQWLCSCMTGWPVGHADTIQVLHLAAHHVTGLHDTTHNFYSPFSLAELY